LPPAKVRKVFYLLAKLNVISVYLNLIGGGGREVHETFKGAQAIKVL
jgi:hypothetical protein